MQYLREKAGEELIFSRTPEGKVATIIVKKQ